MMNNPDSLPDNYTFTFTAGQLRRAFAAARADADFPLFVLADQLDIIDLYHDIAEA